MVIFTAMFIMEVPGNLSLQGGWAELLGTEMAEKVSDVGVGTQTGLKPAPMDWKVREETAESLTVAWNRTLKPSCCGQGEQSNNSAFRL